ncbi:MAG TPA: hypothetical protein VHA05_03835 [Candidatus Saccharimonadales bacterium]|nr:hypothetical protein [Candidatus Saccharimonadales bacterium]
MFGHDDHHDENDKPHEEHQHDDSWQHPGPPPSDDDLSNDNPSAASDSSSPAAPDDHADDAGPEPHTDQAAADFSLSQHSTDYEDTGTDSSDDSSGKGSIGGADNELIDLKQEALTKLSPLIGHLDQTPDEKFRTLMMMIQASDDQRLVRQAYETALNINDEKERAQALLDIVNEINYFTHNPASGSND